jgi:outer membrane protein assembly factor BamB
MHKITLTFILLLNVFHLFSQEIIQWRGPNRDGVYSETGLLKTWPEKGPELLWHFDGLGLGHSSAAVTKTMVYTCGTAGTKGFVIALDLSGKTIWKTEYGKEWFESWEGVRTTPLVAGDRLYVLSGYGKLVCMDAKKGNIIWSAGLLEDYDGQNIVWGITENLLVDGDNLFCTPGGKDANVIALNKNTGKLIWKSKGNGEKSAYCSPALIKLANKHIVVTMTESHILGIDASDGKLLWMHEQPNQYSVHANTPLYNNGFLYCVSGYGKGGVMLKLADDGSSITEVWRNTSLDNRIGGVVLFDGRIYGAGDFSKKWICLDWKTGNELFSSNFLKAGNIIFADNMLYCYDEGGNVALVEPAADSFKEISRFKVPFGEKQHWAHLVIANKKLYVRHGSSLMVYSIAAK